MNPIKVNDLVKDASGRTYRVLALVSVYGIPSADLRQLRQDGTDSTRVKGASLKVKNLPVSCLDRVG